MWLDTFPQLETERLRLRPMDANDAEALFGIYSDGEVTKDMGMEPLTKAEQAEGVIHFMNGLFEEKKAIRWGIVKKADDTLIGTCGFNQWELTRGARGEIAYDLSKAHWRQGYATEAVRRVLAFGFETAGFYRIEALTNLDAAPSIRFLQRLGFSEEGVLRGFSYMYGQYADQRCFSLLKAEWNKR